MYLMFRYKNMKPSDFYWLPQGEKIILKCFMEREIHDRNEEIKHMYGGE
nr:hypothetical protein [uncultured Cellulosilyticum sp.]